MNITVIRATETWQQAGAYYVRIQGMAKQHNITLRREFDEHDAPDTKYIVLTDDDFPVATCRFYPLDGSSAMIGRVVVLPEYRGKGLGIRVVEEAESWLRELGYTLAVVESRDVAVNFYRRLGYEITDSTVIHGDTFDCIRMEKPLCGINYPELFGLLFPGFFLSEDIRAIPEEQVLTELVMDLRTTPEIQPVPCPWHITFGE